MTKFQSGNKVKQKLNSPSRSKKFGQPFQRLWVWEKPTNALNCCKFLIAKRLAVWRLEHNGESQCDSNIEKILPIICAVIA